MKLLIVEDDAEFVEVLQDALALTLPANEMTICRSRDSALAAIGADVFDYAILDLKLPTVDDLLDAEVEHGQAIYRELQATSPGTPVCFLTAFATEDFITDLLNVDARRVDVWGAGPELPMVRMLRKGRLPELAPIINEVRQQLSGTEDIELISEVPLSPHESRVLRIVARRNQAGSLIVAPLSGLSDLRVLKLTVRDRQGATRLVAAARVGERVQVRREIQNYHRDVIRLPNGTFSVFVDEVFAGAGSLAGVFYRLIGEFEPLSELIRRDEDAAVAVVARLQEIEQPWTTGPPQSDVTVADIRRGLLPDSEMDRARPFLEGIEWQTFEQRRVLARMAAQHQDLHGNNVLLVGVHQEPTLIDFAWVGQAPACLDALTLEFSLLFHPTCRMVSAHWPTIAQTEGWYDVEVFAANSPAARFIRAARQWATTTADGRRVMYATAYALAMRQLKYEDTDKRLAVAIIRGAITATQHT